MPPPPGGVFIFKGTWWTRLGVQQGEIISLMPHSNRTKPRNQGPPTDMCSRILHYLSGVRSFSFLFFPLFFPAFFWWAVSLQVITFCSPLTPPGTLSSSALYPHLPSEPSGVCPPCPRPDASSSVPVASAHPPGDMAGCMVGRIRERNVREKSRWRGSE